MRPVAAGLLAAGLLAGCTEPPSYELGWRLVDASGFAEPELAPAMTSIRQCSAVGVQKVRVTTRRLDNSVADRREYPCFPGAFERGELVEGPTLEPGEYKLELAGLRRTGERWACVDDESLPEPAPCVAFAEGTLTVAEGELPALEVVLLSPSECDDGVDNDGDGLVDGKDPSCILDPTGPEQSDETLALFQIKATFLDSPVVFPANVGVNTLRVIIDGEPFVDVLSVELNTELWPFRLPSITASFEPGEHELEIVALDQSGAALTVPLTRSFAIPFAIFGGSGGAEDDPFRFDFSSERFLEPVLEPISVNFGLLLNLGDTTGPTCELGGFVDGERVAVERTWVRVTDEDGALLDAASLDLFGFSAGLSGQAAIAPVDEVEGWVSFACPSSTVVSAPLVWGKYSIEVEGRIGESVCFATQAPRDLRPLGKSGAQDFYLDRVLDGMGGPPAGCAECVVDSDCSGQICDAGICKDKLP